jgi:hypothetical protein
LDFIGTWECDGCGARVIITDTGDGLQIETWYDGVVWDWIGPLSCQNKFIQYQTCSVTVSSGVLDLFYILPTASMPQECWGRYRVMWELRDSTLVRTHWTGTLLACGHPNAVAEDTTWDILEDRPVIELSISE